MRLTDIQKIEIVNKYKTKLYSLKELANQYNITPQAVSQLLNRRGVKNNIIDSSGKFTAQYSLNENYFDIIDNEDKAYFLGFLYADGYNHQKRGLIELSLQESDKHILDSFNLLVNNTKPLYFRDRKTKNIKHKNIYRLTMQSQHMSHQLALLGCKQCKTFDLTFPNPTQVSNYLIKHFLRGYWDGDGTIGFYKTKRNTYTVSTRLVGTKDLLIGVQKYFYDTLGIITPICDIKNSVIKVLYITSKINTYNILSHLYKNSTIYLNRKYDKFVQIETFLQNQNKYNIFK